MRRLFMELFTKLNQEFGRTIILVTHEEDIAQYAKRVIRIVDGEISSDSVAAVKNKAVKKQNLELDL